MQAKKQYFLDKEKELTKQIIDFVRNNDIKKDNDNYSKLKELITLLFEENISFYGNSDQVELKFDEAKSDIAGRYQDNTFYSYKTNEIVKRPHIITLYENNKSYNGIFSDDTDVKEKAIIGIIRVLYHEIYHYSQMNSVRNNISSLKALKFAKEHMALSVMENREDYTANHDKYMIESDANLRAILKVNKLRITESSNLFKHLLMFSFSRFQIRDKSGLKVKEVDRDEYIDKLIEFTLKGKAKLYYLRKYPILQKEYDIGGEKRPFDELVVNYINEYRITGDINTKRMYLDILLRSLIESKPNISSDAEYKVLLEILNYIQDEKNICISFLESEYQYRIKFDNELNYMPHNSKETRFYAFNNTYVYNIEEAKGLFDLDLIYNNKNLTKEEKEASVAFINNYFLKRLPSSGLFILKNGDKINLLDFYKKYIIPNIKSLYNMTLNEYLEFLKEYVESDTYTMYVINKERINKKYERYENIINSYISSYNKSYIKERKI